MKKVKKKIKKMLFWKPWVSGLVIGLVLALGITASAITIDGSVDEIRALFAQEREEQSLGGNLTATGGIQDASAPVVTANNWDFYDLDVTNRFAVDGTTTLTGTSTISKSYDGFTAYKNLTIATTSTQTVYSNASGVDSICDGGTFALDADGTTFAPSLQFVLGTSTAATYSANLLASSTMATTTDYIVLSTYTKPFKVANGEYITARLGDITNANASSTYYGNWTMEASIHCTLLGA